MNRLAVIVVILVAWVPTVHAETRALVIGIDKYKWPTSELLGAVNDATDVAGALSEIGVSDVVVLKDEKASRDEVTGAWKTMLARSTPGDTILVHFAGHGAQSEDVDPPDEKDQSDEVFLLVGFNEEQGFSEKLVDDEIYGWSQTAAADGVNVIFILDTCHSGGLARAVDFRRTKGRSRITSFRTRPTKSQGPLSSAVAPLDLGPNTVLITATGENQKVEEFFDQGQWRGILTKEFARGLRGEADLDHDGTLTSLELIRYVEPLVRSGSNNAQDPQSFAPALPIIVVAGLDKTQTMSSGPLASLPTVAVLVRGEDSTDNNWRGATVAFDEAKSDLIWVPEEGKVISAQGDVLAVQSDALGFQRSIDAMRVAKAFEEFMKRGNVLSVLLAGGYGIYCEGSEFQITSSKSAFRHYTAVDLTATGDVQFLYPSPDLKSHQLEWTSVNPWWFTARVGAPYGSDLVLLVASERPLLSLLGAFKSKQNRTLPALEFFDLLQTELASTKYEAGMVRIFTQEQTAEDGSKCAEN